jgi:periodic tryptophan protein 1
LCDNRDQEDINDVSDEEDIIKKYGLDDYDEEGEESDLAAVIGGMKGLMYKSNKEDPNITLHDEAEQDEIEDVLIRPTDSLLVTCVSSEDELSHLDVYVVDEVQNAQDPSTYIHHDYLLPAMPLSLAWLNYHPVLGAADPNKAHNMVCVGSFEPGIEIWDLDTMDTPKPVAILGGSVLSHELLQSAPSEQKKTSLQSKKARHKQLVPDSHRDAVLGLAWNQLQRTVLASSSADQTVKCWDLSKQAALLTLQHHSAGVQCVAWHTNEAAMLASGGFDKKVHLTDIRVGKSGAVMSVNQEVECVQWLPWSSYHVLVSDEGGNMFAFDIRQLGQGKSRAGQLWQCAAHSEACMSISVSRVSGLIATCSPERDSPVKLWDIRGESVNGEVTVGKPSCVYSKTKSLGPSFSLAFSPDTPLLLAVGGKHGQPLLLNAGMLSSVQSRFHAPSAPSNSNAAPAEDEVEIDVYDVNAKRPDEDDEDEEEYLHGGDEAMHEEDD